jgi:SAM-dependent methyltransferase
MADRRILPVEECHADVVLLLNVLERHANPVRLLTEAHRALKPGGVLAIVTEERRTVHEAEFDGVRRFRPHELVAQVRHMELFDVLSAPASGQGALPLIARARFAREDHQPTQPVLRPTAGAAAWRGRAAA